MRILDRYIVREIFRHAFLGLAVFTFVFFVPRLVQLMELFVRHTGSGGQILTLFLCIFPGVLTFTIPMAVLVGVLLGLGRMSSDSEIIAITSLGISRQRMLVPVGVLAIAGTALTLGMTLWLGPLSLRTFRSIETQLMASQISYAVQPRVFDERFPHVVLYINDVSASGTQWHGVFLADTGGESGARLTLAENAIVIAEPKDGKLELHLKNGSTHEFSRDDADHYSLTDFGQSDWPIEMTGLGSAEPRTLSNAEPGARERVWLARRSGGTAPEICVSRSLPGIRARGGAAGRAAAPRGTRGWFADRGDSNGCVLPRFRNGRGICARRHDGAGGGNLGGECAAGDSGTGLASADGADARRKARRELGGVAAKLGAPAATEEGAGPGTIATRGQRKWREQR